MAIIEATDVVKEYRHGERVVRALDGISLSIAAGEVVSVMGPSGSGKSSLLHLLGGLDSLTSGRVVVDGSDLAALDDDALTTFRRRRVGFVFQFFNLLPTLAAWENVALPRLLDGVPLAQERAHATELLARVGLGERADHRPAELSGGEMQRVAVARALVNEPVLVLADEPTGNLDSAAGSMVLDLLRALTSEQGGTLVLVTHDATIAAVADRVIHLADGRVMADSPRPPASSAVAD